MKNISIPLSDLNKRILENDIRDAQEWLENAVAGSLLLLKRKAIAKAVNAQLEDESVETIEANSTNLIRKHRGTIRRDQDATID